MEPLKAIDGSKKERGPYRTSELIKYSVRGLCIAVFIFGAVLFIHAQKRADVLKSTRQSVDLSDTQPAQGFVVEYVSSTMSPDRTVAVIGRSTRYVKANGDWRLVLRHGESRTAQGKTLKDERVYGATSDGVFEKRSDAESRRYVSPSADRSIIQFYRSGNYLRTHPEFFRMDDVAGLEVYVFRVNITDPAYAGYWMEISYCPRTGMTPLRTVRHASDGSETTEEAVVVEFKDVREDLNDDFEQLPIRPTGKRVR